MANKKPVASFTKFDNRASLAGQKSSNALPRDIKESRALNKIEFSRTLNKFIYMSIKDIEEIIKKRDVPAMDSIVAQVLYKAYVEGDTRRVEFILDRLIGKPTFEPSLGAGSSVTRKRSFIDFCTTANYPAPYPKQIEMMNFVVNGGPTNMTFPRLLLGARKYGKTEYCTLLGIAYKIYLDPSFTVLLVTKVEKNGRRFLREIARILEANGVTIAVDNANEIKVQGHSGKESNVMLLTIGSSGFRSLHPDLIVFDDPVVPGAVSEADRDQVKNVYSEAMKLSKNIALIGQPVDFRDLYGYLRDIIETMEVPHGTIPELDDDLDVIRASGVDEKSIQASYFLRVEPEGDASFHNINRIQGFHAEQSIAFMDPSEGGDYTALGIFSEHLNGMAIVGFAWKKAWHLCIEDLKKLCIKYKVKKLGFETNMFGVLPLQVLRENLHDIGVVVDGKYTHSNKEARIQLAAQFSKALYLSSESDQEYIRQVVEYSHDAKFDDSPDTIATFMEWAGKIRPPKAMKKPSKEL